MVEEGIRRRIDEYAKSGSDCCVKVGEAVKVTESIRVGPTLPALIE